MLKKCRYIPRLETERLVLREITENDTEDLRAWLGLSEVYTYWGRGPSNGEKNPELLFIDPRPHVKRKPSPDYIWGIESKKTGALIGIIEVFDIEGNRYGMVGYRIAPWLWNSGICTEALKCVVRYVFHETEMDRLEAHADVRNIGSNRVLEKCGFQKEGTIRHGKMHSVYCDYNIWGMIRADMEKT